MTAFDADRFDALVARLAPLAQPAPAPGDALDLLVASFLLWETTPSQADRAAKKLAGAFVDLNELRVARVDEICAVLGVRYPRAEERAGMLKRTLNDIYNREHALTLAPLNDRNKRDAKQYLASLDACPQFVASRVVLIGLGAHAAPVDGVIHARLEQEGVFTEPVDLERAASLLERHIRAEDALATHLALESAREEAGAEADRPRRKGPARREAAAAPKLGKKAL